MKRTNVFWRGLVVLGAAVLLLGSSGFADPTPHKKKHPAADTDDDGSDATPTPSPAAKKSAHHHAKPAEADDSQPTPAASATPTKSETEAGFHKDTAGGSGSTPEHPPAPAATSSIETSELRDFDALPAAVRQLLNSGLDLTRRNLTYTYGSADPANGGLDCSGTIYYLLKAAGFEDVPRSASEQYAWVRRRSTFYAVLSKKEDSFELNELRPGDLLFWTGTYNVDHDPPVTHTMLYLGRRKKDGKPLMLGASDGRPYDGEKRNGVSVFDFKLPAARSADAADAATAAAPDHSPDFAGYGPIPGMADRNEAAKRQAGNK